MRSTLEEIPVIAPDGSQVQLYVVHYYARPREDAPEVEVRSDLRDWIGRRMRPRSQCEFECLDTGEVFARAS
jgi:hypothetical protein